MTPSLLAKRNAFFFLWTKYKKSIARKLKATWNLSSPWRALVYDLPVDKKFTATAILRALLVSVPLTPVHI